MNHFTDAELQTLSAEIDSQLIELAKDSDGVHKHIGHTVPAKQKQQLEQVIEQDLGTKEPADSFMKKFARAAKQDLCVEGGVLYGQWKKYGDLENEAMLKTFSGILISMGISNALLATAVVR
jgi:hypothetical protein